MNALNKRKQAAVKFATAVLLVLLLATALSACTTPNPTRPTETIPAIEPSLTALPTIEPTALITLVPMDESSLHFEEGRYKRDKTCGRAFNYHQVVHEDLTVAIADNFLQPQDRQMHAERVITIYNALAVRSPVPFRQPLTIYILPDPTNGDCISRDHRVFVDPTKLDSVIFAEDVIGAATGIREYWIKTGLTSLALGDQPDDEALRNWYQSTEDLDMAGLFYARFHKDWATEKEREIAHMSAAALVQYALEVENIVPERLRDQVNNDVRTRWLASLGVDRAVDYPYDGRFAGFTYSSSAECPLVVQADTMHFCLNRLPEQGFYDEIADVEFLITQAYYGRKALVDYVLVEAPSVRYMMEPEELITITVKELGNRLGFTDSYENTITINSQAVYYYPLHEVVHTFDWNQSFRGRPLWLIEGSAEYLRVHVPIYPQAKKHAIFEDLSGRVWDKETSGVEGLSYWYMLLPEQFSMAKNWYLAQGGSMEDEASVDVRLYSDAVAFATMYNDSRGLSIGEIYDALYPGRSQYWEGQDGLELSYTQAASFFGWLCDIYTLDRVLDVYVNGAENGLLDGKTYDALKSAWQDHLRAKGAGIAIPDQP